MGFQIENGLLKKYAEESGVTEVVIPDSVTAIGDHAFAFSRSLTSIVIPDSVTAIGSGAFYDCSNLQIHVSSLEHYMRLRIADPHQLFVHDILITDITNLEGVTVIGDGAFAWCSSLTSIVIPDSVTAIGDGAFGGCCSLTSIVIPESVTAIGDRAFRYCSSLKSIVIPDSVTTIGDGAFENCYRLTSIAIPDSVTAIGDGAFGGCRSLKSIVIPESVTAIGDGAFGKCGNLEKVIFRNKDVAFAASSFSSCDKLKEMVFPDEFLATTQCYHAMLIPFIKGFTRKEAAYIWIFQDDKWLAAVQRSRDDVNQVAQHIVEIISKIEKLTPKVQTRLNDFVDWAYPEINREEVQKLCDAVAAKNPKVAKKFLASEAVQRGLGGERTIEKSEPLEEFARSLLEKRPLHPNATVFTKGIPYTGEKKLCTPRLLNILVSEYLYLYDIYQKTAKGEMTTYVKLDVPQNAVIPEGADQIAKALDRNALSNALENMVYSCSKAYRPWMYAYARFATEESAKKLLHHPPSGSPSKVRYWRENLDEAMLFSETKAAIEHLEKKGLLEKYTRIRGMSVQEFRDRYFLPKWDMDETGMIKSAYGRLGFALTSDFTLRPVELATGKELRSVSAKTDPDAAREYKELKKEVADFYKKRAEYIRGMYITAESMDAQTWRNTYCRNPILRPVTQKIIWMDEAGESFMLNGDLIQDVRGAEYDPKNRVVIAHVLDMSADQIEAWQNRLAESGKKLLIEQVWEPLAAISNISTYAEAILSKEERNELKRVLGRKAIVIKSESDYSEFDHRANRYIFSDTGTMYVGQSLQIDYRFNEERSETTLCNLRCTSHTLTRELNTILFELGRVCIKSVIRKDEVELLSQLLTERFTAAQVAEFIRLVEGNGCAAATAILLEYKQAKYPDTDPFADFVLEW